MNTSSSAVGSTRARRDPRPARGFTLIELMITVAIIAILAAIAIPSYQDSVWKAKRAEAKAAMLKALQAEERYFTQNNTYVGYSYSAPPSGAFPGYSADSASNSRYQIAAAAAGVAPLCTDNNLTKCIVITATVIGSADPKCGLTLQMDSIGNKTSASGNAICWN